MTFPSPTKQRDPVETALLEIRFALGLADVGADGWAEWSAAAVAGDWQ